MLKKEGQQAKSIVLNWVDRVNAGDLDGVINLYAEDAILLPTFASNIFINSDEITAYFSMLSARPGLRVELDEAEFRATNVRDNIVSIVGKYTFYFDQEGQSTAYPSRFTFVVALNSDHPISHHHSTVLPVSDTV